ncbi:hypothetical protein [Methylobacterium sp. PvR107]|uniref:hypothetical protein n=1 Tax=Methylobacterium sp. PvR107 TaxID=2806597 RepID=UPI0028A7CE5A|nr:hypothetical protein [Methylobacterium sp. PvR107]
MKGKKRCRMHGGAIGSGAPSGSQNDNYQHGQRTRAAATFKAKCQEGLAASRAMLRRIP